MSKIRVAIADDIPQIVKYFKMIVEREADMEVVGEAYSGKEAIALASTLKPDVILIDIQMETEFAGITAIEQIKQKHSDINMIVLTNLVEDEIIFSAYIAGAVNFLAKNASIVDIINSIRNVYKQERVMRAEVVDKMVNELTRLRTEKDSILYVINLMFKLTAAEFEVLKLAYDGRTCKQIARLRNVEEVTVRTQINRILSKFEKKSMKEIVKMLKQLKIFESLGKLT